MAEVVIPYKPRPTQKALHRDIKRFNVICAHRRFGKTTWAIAHAVRAAVTNRKPLPRYAFVSPLRSQSKVVAWDSILKPMVRDVPGVTFNEQELRADFPHNESRITLAGGDSPDSLRGQRFDGVICDEFGQMHPRVWSEILRPALTDRKGWAVFIGTPAGMDNNFSEIYQHAEVTGGNWFARTYRADETGIIDPEELEDARRSMSKAEYEQEFLCSWQSNTRGSIFGEEVQEAQEEGRICAVPHDKAALVNVAFDLGISDTFTMWFFQEVGREIHFIDYYENTGMGLDHYVKVLRDKPYNYGRYLFPHDVSARELGTGVSRAETLQTLGITPTVMPRTNPEDRISAARMAFGRLWFDKDKCAEGLRALRAYRFEYSEKLRILKPKPLHNWASHAADSFGLATEGFKVARPRSVMRKPDRSWIV
tara:strand:+ start:44 stop:1312 length:1269 start_codon:yes stop_codon:yes gene_type:complete